MRHTVRPVQNIKTPTGSMGLAGYKLDKIPAAVFN
jgi:hypothetical protein